VVHGGERFTRSVLVDDEVVAAISSVSHLAPLHNPANLAGIEAVRAVRPDLPQVAVFDTAFHRAMSARAFRYAVPEEWYTRYGVRRYGFHGTSYRFVSERTAALPGRPLTGLRLVIAHLGNGCSAAAIRDGVPVDTTRGLTPLEGLEMGTRSGDVDPGVFGYLADRAGLTVGAITWALNTASGLAGLSGVGNDMRAVEAAAAGGNERARLALEVFVHRLGFLGLTGDPAANARHGRGTGGRISRPGTALALVVPTDEELLIARDTARLIATVAAAGRDR
jgi:acetate kinase